MPASSSSRSELMQWSSPRQHAVEPAKFLIPPVRRVGSAALAERGRRTYADQMDAVGASQGRDQVDATVFRDTLARVPTPVTVVTSHVDRRPHGTTVSAFSSLSLEPPMILVSLDQRSDLLKIIQETGRFGVNVLAVGQQALATAFARKGDDKFADVAWYMDHGAPRLAGKGQWLVCRTEQLVTAGDHVIIIGLVEHADTHSFEPLLYRQRSYGPVPHMRS